MRRPGEFEPEYAIARRALLDALEALEDQLDAVTLVGAQAVYLLCGEADMAIAPFTRDGDVAIDPGSLKSQPKLEAALLGAGFVPHEDQVGRWMSRGDVPIDLLVPEGIGGAGRRAARLAGHGRGTARKVRGLEGVLVDRERRQIAALEESDAREFEMYVAGPAALLIAKVFKLSERSDSPGRLVDKDALDVLRLLRAFEAKALAHRLERILADPRASTVAVEAIDGMRALFRDPASRGSRLAARAVEGVDDPEVVAASCAVLTDELLRTLRRTDLGKGKR